MPKEKAPVSGGDQVERVFYESFSFVIPSIIISAAVLTVTIAAAVVVKIWWVGPLGVLAFISAYFQNKRRNRYMITTNRFIRELFHPSHTVAAVPLKEIENVKILNRATDKTGNVRVETAPAFGDQLLVDGERELGVIMCYKVPSHANFREVLTTAVDNAKKPEK